MTYDSFGYPLSGINLALGHYDGVTFVAVPQLAVQVSCSSGGDCVPGMAGVYLAVTVDGLGTHIFTHNKWRIRNQIYGIENSDDLKFPGDHTPKPLPGERASNLATPPPSLEALGLPCVIS